MSLRDHLIESKGLYLAILSWPVLGFFLPSEFVAVWSIITFYLILRAGDYGNVFIALMAVLLFSDSYLPPFQFAALAKIGFVVVFGLQVILNNDQYTFFDASVFRNFIPFLGFALIACAWSVNFSTSLQKAISYALIFFVVPLVFQRALREDVDFPKSLIHFYSIFMVSGLLLFIVNPDIAILGGRFRGLLGNPNGIGTMLTLLAPLAYLLFKRYNYEIKDLSKFWLFGVSFVICLILCGSRTALIAIFLLAFFIRIRFLSNITTILLFATFMLTYDMLLASLPQVAASVGLEEYFRIETLDEGSGRFVAWNFAWQKINDVFFLGGGFGYTEYIYKLNYNMLSMLGHQGNAHNSYLTLWLDTGLIGIILLFVGFIQTILKANSLTPLALPIFYAVFISANFESWLAASLNPFTSLFLVLITLLCLPPESRIESLTESNEQLT